MLEGNSSVLLSANNDPEEDLFKNHSSKNGRNVIKQCSKGTASSYSNKHHSLSSNTYKFKIYEVKNFFMLFWILGMAFELFLD